MKKKTVSPYEQLRLRAKEWATAVLYPHSVGMRFYKKESLANGFRLDDLYERVAAAEQIGYDVVLVAMDNGLHVRYRKRPPAVPWQFS